MARWFWQVNSPQVSSTDDEVGEGEEETKCKHNCPWTQAE